MSAADRAAEREHYCRDVWRSFDPNVLPIFAADPGGGFNNFDFHALPPGSLRGADFRRVTVSGADFEGQDLTCARFEGAGLGDDVMNDNIRKSIEGHGKVMQNVRAQPIQRGEAGGFFNAVLILGPTSFINTNLDHADFSGAYLAADFTAARLRCTDFSDADLSRSHFGVAADVIASPTCMTAVTDRAQITVEQLRALGIGTANSPSWPQLDFTYAKVIHSVGRDTAGREIDFANLNLSHAHLAHTDLNHLSFQGADLSHADFRSTLLTGSVNFSKVTTRSGPVNFSSAQASEANFSSASLEQAEFSGATLIGAHFPRADLQQASFVSAGGRNAASVSGDADFSNADFRASKINFVQFSGDRMVGAHFDGITAVGTRFDRAKLVESTFKGADLQSVSFDKALLTNVDFTGATMQTSPVEGAGSQVSFDCAQLGGANFTNAKVLNASFNQAVVPLTNNCCSLRDGEVNCGQANYAQQSKLYGPVKLPSLSSGSIICPDGSGGACSGAQWQLSANWTSRACSASGQARLMWSAPNCSGDAPSQPGALQIPDAGLRACVQAELGSGVITGEAAQSLTSLTCSGRGISRLEGLQLFPNLKKLDLSHNSIANFSLPDFPSIIRLIVSSNHMTSLNLTGLPNLQYLDASDNALSEITLDALADLRDLNVAGNQLTSFDLRIHSRLISADLSHNRLTSVFGDGEPNDLLPLTKLTYLDVGNNQLQTIGSGVNSLTELGTLTLNCNEAFACETLAAPGAKIQPALAASGCHVSQTGVFVAGAHPASCAAP